MESEMSLWVVVDVGCLECGNDSTCFGVFSTRSEAEAEVANIDLSEGSRGEGQTRLFEVPGIDVVGEFGHMTASRSGEQPPPPPPGSAGSGGGTDEEMGG
jgi:hypothetical protein